jgi:hypothetical protein
VKTLVVRPVEEKAVQPIKTGILGRLGRVFETYVESSGGRGPGVFAGGEQRDFEGGVLSVLSQRSRCQGGWGEYF